MKYELDDDATFSGLLPQGSHQIAFVILASGANKYEL
jgi:hypothetical protein